MVILLTGASHTGKTLLAQRLVEKYRYPCFSVDHLKMGLIRSGNTSPTPEDDDELEKYLWPILREMAKTAVENGQNLLVEGCYIPLDWKKDFSEEYLREMRCVCLVMSEKYIREHFSDIKAYANVIERRLDDSGCTMESVLAENERYRTECERCGCGYILIDSRYPAEFDLSAVLQSPPESGIIQLPK